MIRNPVLKGFNPDPSICRVGADYYIATSTFEWYPGVQIHHSTDLVNWRLVSRPLNRKALLDMRGNPDSCGVWAPCLSHADGRFWLVYTDVKRFDGAFKDAHNYITTCETIDGEWTDPWYINSSGFDPSLFHDEGGKKWFLNMRWNHRGPGTGLNPAHDRFDGIELQEWSPKTGLTGPVHTIYTGSPLGLTEAPHLFKRGGWYYLTVAEGGTGYDHAVTMARSRSITGPYETHPNQHLMTARFDPASPLQRVGHGQYVEAPDGTPWHTFLCGRPLPGTRACPLGRETGLARCEWRDDDWLYLTGNAMVPSDTLPANAEPQPQVPSETRFDGPALPPEFQWLRTPEPDRIFRLTGSALRMIGRESLGSWFEQSLVARRQEHHAYRAEASFLADPPGWQHAIGLTTYYNRHKFHAALITREKGQRCLTLVSCLGDWPGEKLTYHGAPIPLAEGEVRLAVEVNGAAQRFHLYGAGGWAPVGPVLDASIISDEGGRGEHASFTGAFVGLVAHDLTGQGWAADVTYFRYEPRS
ncbi:glycoside hydrolase family 43 protein [Neotabrizicola shimadae]|uniref:Glycoside hydrolase family 43 protein n=1 Tax=Neotabrizicola shimadae TaxID=2807096 RepID=A0A8G1ECM8_9RHOB|nr:glycoside hydrolase family 43 protein [Neotabrizicola shimadae]QYZ70617.1 glycoside hydrolase family 43 protein [Neotabrizicola shimadae]